MNLYFHLFKGAKDEQYPRKNKGCCMLMSSYDSMPVQQICLALHERHFFWYGVKALGSMTFLRFLALIVFDS